MNARRRGRPNSRSQPLARIRGRLLSLVAILSFLTGCASSGYQFARPAPETLPERSPLRVASLADPDAWLRHHLVFAQPDSALALLTSNQNTLVKDRLLRALQEALVLRAAGEFARSNELLEWADEEAEMRRVRSVSESAGVLVINDRVASYLPSPAEAGMVPYYRMMNFIALGDAEGAAVEARRIGALLENRGAAEYRCREDGMLRYLAGLAFEAAGDGNDALVSLRQAGLTFDGCVGGSSAPTGFGRDLVRVATDLGLDEIADSARARYGHEHQSPPEGSGEVVLIVERGYIAHLSEQVIHVPIFEREIEELESGDIDDLARTASRIAARLVGNFMERGYWGNSWDDHPAVQVGHALSGAHILRLAWANSEKPERPLGSLRMLAGNESTTLEQWGDLSATVPHELDDKRAASLARLVTRGLTKFLLARQLENKAEKQGGEVLGFVTGRLANLAGNELERADTRSWSLLPDEIRVGRLTLPAGSYDLTIEADGSRAFESGTVRIGTVDVVAGGVTIVNHRLWSEEDVIRLPPGTEIAVAEVE